MGRPNALPGMWTVDAAQQRWNAMAATINKMTMVSGGGNSRLPMVEVSRPARSDADHSDARSR